MSRIAIELIPRDRETLCHSLDIVKQTIPEVDTVNIPDLLRLPLRSWEGAAIAQQQFGYTAIPHIRAMDIAPKAPLPCATQTGITQVLVVAGDCPSDAAHRTYPNTAVDIIQRYQREAPHIRVFAAFDPYRQAPSLELEHLKRKRDAGAAGFFTQPIFEERMFDLCASWLEGDRVYWGLSPVIGSKSRAYWERVNRAVFPKNFEETLEGNLRFSEKILKTLKARGDCAYLMPLRVDLKSFLTPLKSLLV